MPRLGEHKASERAIAAAERARQALELRKNGVDYRTIATRLGYSGPSGAHKAVMNALRAITREPAEELRELELARLDAMLFAIAPQLRAGSLQAIDRALKIMIRRANFLGLDAPKRQENEIVIRDMAQKVAKEFDLDPDLIIREAERIIGAAADG